MSCRGGGQGNPTVFKWLPFYTQCVRAVWTPNWFCELCGVFLSNWNLAWTAPDFCTLMLPSISTSCCWLSISWKNASWKCHQSPSLPELLLAIGGEPACCLCRWEWMFWVLKKRKWKVEIYEESAVMPVQATWGCPLFGELHLEVNWTKWSSMFTSNTDELYYWVQFGSFEFMQ